MFFSGCVLDVSDVDLDPVRSAFILVCGSGSMGIKWRKNKSLTNLFSLFCRNRNMKNALPIIQGKKFIIFKPEPEKEDIIADILLMRANLYGLGSALEIKWFFLLLKIKRCFEKYFLSTWIRIWARIRIGQILWIQMHIPSMRIHITAWCKVFM